MDIYDLKYQWRDLVSRNQSVFRFNVGFYFGMPWPWGWRWCWEILSFPSGGVYALETPFFEIVFVDRLG